MCSAFSAGALDEAVCKSHVPNGSAGSLLPVPAPGVGTAPQRRASRLPGSGAPRFWGSLAAAEGAWLLRGPGGSSLPAAASRSGADRSKGSVSFQTPAVLSDRESGNENSLVFVPLFDLDHPAEKSRLLQLE